MAPRRHHGHAGTEVQNLLGVSMETALAEHHHLAPVATGLDAPTSNVTRCCVPTGECLRANTMAGNPNNNDYVLISLDDLRDTVRVTCNNDSCTMGRYMHRECFEAWEQSILTYLKTCGRARSWSERQRHQNLWTKKGYDLAFKACGCKCGRGHLKKDLDWVPPPPTSGVFRTDDMEVNAKKKKRRNRNNTRPSLAISAHPQYHPNSNQGITGPRDLGLIAEARGRAGSLSSSTGSSSPPASGSDPSISPIHSGTKKKSRFDFFSDRVRAGSGANGIFTRRQDFSSFNALPRHKLNSYHIKMEDEGNHGNDETRCFILSTLASMNRSRVICVLCDEEMLVYDRYPLVDGTFFLSPRKHHQFCPEVKVEGRQQFLTAVCMACLEGREPSRQIYCRFCSETWNGSSLILGTMYSYDIFAATPCCIERIKCNACRRPLLHPHQRLNFYSDYSHLAPCPHCRQIDNHFVKPLNECFTRELLPPPFQQWP